MSYFMYHRTARYNAVHLITRVLLTARKARYNEGPLYFLSIKVDGAKTYERAGTTCMRLRCKILTAMPSSVKGCYKYVKRTMQSLGGDKINA
ncbi:hypothetical protein ABEB36_013921 [Hypothenemus hampei]|uniref:Uncharacterized protein n=1 Tax=Hypothenemus hampei TaxID=57062 RepID=A0ABD1E601_HYPHA